MASITVEFGEGVRSPDPSDREAALVGALVQLAERASWDLGLLPCPVFSTLAAVLIDTMLERGHIGCAAHAAEEIGATVAISQRQQGSHTDA